MATRQENETIAQLGSIEAKLKLFEETRLKSFENWQFEENEKCSASEVNIDFN